MEKSNIFSLILTKIIISLNSYKSLKKVKGICPKIAKAIVAYRNKNGSFKSVDDLLQVKGITKKKLDKIRTNLTV